MSRLSSANGELELNLQDAMAAFCNVCTFIRSCTADKKTEPTHKLASYPTTTLSTSQAHRVLTECSMLINAVRPIAYQEDPALFKPTSTDESLQLTKANGLSIVQMCLEHIVSHKLGCAWRNWVAALKNESIIAVECRPSSTSISTEQDSRNGSNLPSSPSTQILQHLLPSPNTQSLMRVLKPLKQLTERQRQVFKQTKKLPCNSSYLCLRLCIRVGNYSAAERAVGDALEVQSAHS